MSQTDRDDLLSDVGDERQALRHGEVLAEALRPVFAGPVDVDAAWVTGSGVFGERARTALDEARQVSFLGSADPDRGQPEIDEGHAVTRQHVPIGLDESLRQGESQAVLIRLQDDRLDTSAPSSRAWASPRA